MWNRTRVIIFITTKTGFFKEGMPIPFPAHKPDKVSRYYIKGIEKGKKSIFTSKLFWLDTNFNMFQPLIQRREARQFKLWKRKNE